MAELITILWRDIPAQVTARDGRKKASIQLHDRFQIAIDRAAVKAGKKTTDDYLAEWRREAVPCGENLSSVADRAAADLEERFTQAVLREYVRNGGYAPESEQS